MLLENRANKEAPSEGKLTALYLAAYFDHVEVANMFRRHHSSLTRGIMILRAASKGAEVITELL